MARQLMHYAASTGGSFQQARGLIHTMNTHNVRSAYPLAIGVFLFVFLTAVFSIYMALPPSPVPATAPPTEFSAERALEFDRGVASVPHPAGSPANQKTPQYILDKLQFMGISAELYSSRYVRGLSAGQANVVLARIPGAANTKAFAMEAYYDSVSYGPSPRIVTGRAHLRDAHVHVSARRDPVTGRTVRRHENTGHKVAKIRRCGKVQENLIPWFGFASCG
jgi:hypothetical protein